MANKLLIRFFENDYENVEWLAIDPIGEIIQPCSKSKLAELPPFAKDTIITVLVPTARVLLTTAKLPKISQARLHQAIPYALEDQLSTEIEHLHFALGKHDADNNIAVAVVEQQQMQQWLEALQKNDLYAHNMVPDVLALPLSPETWICAIEKETVLIRTNPQYGCSVDRNNLITLLNFMLEEAKDKKPNLVVFENHIHPEGLENLESSLENVIHVQINNNPTPFLVTAASVLQTPPLINLLQASHKSSRKLPQLKSQWQIAKWLALAWLIIIVAGSLAQYFYLKIRVDSLTNQINTLYQQVSPSAIITSTTTVKPELERQLRNLTSAANGGHFLGLLGKVGAVLHAQNIAQIQQLSYQNNQLSINLLLNNFPDLEKITQQLKAQGLDVTQNNVTSQNKLVSAQLNIKGGN